ncbi:MAG: hypothetical protein V1743_01340 [Nanoarchaeota archaeon]
MANINIEIPEKLHKELKIVATLKGIHLKGLVIMILESSVDQGSTRGEKGKKGIP